MDEYALVPIHGDAAEGIRLDTWRSLLKWLEQEDKAWSWLHPGDGITDQHNIATGVRGNLEGVIRGIRELEAQSVPISAANQYLTNFAPRGSLWPSESTNGATVLDILATAGSEAAAFAYAFSKRQVGLANVANADQFRGALLTVIPEGVKPCGLSDRLKREREAYRSASREATRRLEDQSAKLDARAVRQLRRARRIVKAAFKTEQESWDSAKRVWLDDAQKAVADIRSVENAYRESMKLQAPVEYWTTKAASHRVKEERATWRLRIFFPAALMTIIVAFSASAYLVLSVASDLRVPSALYVVLSGGLAVVVTMTFWIGRLFTKLYLSEHHLRNDAEERAVMTTTYLALTRESAAEETDRHIVLTALFRSSPDGIVKDDGPADLTIQAMVARALTK